LIVERFDQDGIRIKGSFEQELKVEMAQVWNDDAEGSKMDLTVVIPNNFNAKTEFKFKIKGYLEEVLYHTSEEIEVTTTNNITFE